MVSEAATILKHGWLFMLANVVNRAAGLLLLPLYTHILTPSEFGIYALVLVVTDLLAVMLTIGLSNAFTAVYFEHADEDGRRRVVSSCLLALVIMSVLLVVFAWPMGLLASYGLFGNRDHVLLTALAVGSVALSTLFEVALAYFRMRKRSYLCVGVALAKVAALLLFNLIFLWALPLGVAGIFVANAASFVLLAVIMLVMILRETGVSFDRKLIWRMARIGLPYMPQSLLDIGNLFIARWLLNVMATTAAVGLFAFGLRLSQVIYMFLTASFLQIWSVRQLESQHEQVDRQQTDLVFHLFVVLLAAAGLGLSLLGPEVLWLIADAEYKPVLTILPFLAFSYVIHGIRMNPEVAILKAKQVWILPWLSGVSFVVGSGVMVVMLMQWGVFGAAIANLLREIVQLLITEVARRRLIRDEPALKPLRLLGIIVPAALAAVAGWWIWGDIVDPLVAVQKLGLVLLVILLALFGPGIGADGRTLLNRMTFGRLRRAQTLSS